VPPTNGILVPFGSTDSAETNVQVPTSCSFSDFVWATALLNGKASAKAVMPDKLRKLRRFIVSPWCYVLRARLMVRRELQMQDFRDD
jgi:hypothetical protein